MLPGFVIRFPKNAATSYLYVGAIAKDYITQLFHYGICSQ
jgi:hypothetical protein